MMIKQIVKTVALALFFVVFAGCEADVDNTVPQGEKKLSAFQQDFKNILIKNSIKGNGKIWLSNRLQYGSYYNFLYSNLRNKKGEILKYGFNNPVVQYFFMGFEFLPDNTSKTYITLGQRDLQTKSKTSDLYDNINPYRVGGDLRTELTILNQGVLSKLKKESTLDFEYRITSYSDKEIKIKPYFTQTVNPEITLRPYDIASLKVFSKASEILYGGSSGNFFYTLWDSSITKIVESSSKRTVGNFTSSANWWTFSNLLVQDYDKDKNLFVFRFFDLPREAINNNIDILGLPSLHFFYDTTKDIKYLVPISATDDKMVFETYGKDKASDKKYTVTITKK